jgi:ATP-dependent RNA helicase RhlE
LADFKDGKIRVLVATDIAARGLDIDQLPHVVNYELPNVPEDYVHRIGRTGRAERTGEAISLVCIDEHKLLRDIERLLKREIPRFALEGYEPDPNIKADPIQNGRQGRGAQRPGMGRGNGAGRPHRGGAGHGDSRPHRQVDGQRRPAALSSRGRSRKPGE